MLSDQQWAEAARELMARTGLAPDGDADAVRWVAIRHAEDHIHVVATLARTDGGRPVVWNDGYRVRDACRAIERRFGLRSTAPADRTAARCPKRGEHEKTARHGRAEVPRVALRRHVQLAAAGARSEQEFFARLRAANVLVRQRFSQRDPTQLSGYAVALPGDHNGDGRPVWFGGGKLAADLTLPRLRHRWRPSQPSAGPSPADYYPVSGRHLSQRTAGAVLRTTVRDAARRARTAEQFFERLEDAGLQVRRRFSDRAPGQITGYAVTLPDHRDEEGAAVWYSGGRLADELTWTRLRERWSSNPPPEPHKAGSAELTHEERQTLYDDAARSAAYATAQIRRYSVINPHAARDACWAAADILLMASKVTGNSHLRRAAKAYDRAARPPYGRLPAPTSAGNGLRTAARLLALVDPAGTRTVVMVTRLVINMVELLESIAQLHQAQRRREQADAASSAAVRLRRIAVPATESTHPQRLDRPSPSLSPDALALHGFPQPWRAETPGRLDRSAANLKQSGQLARPQPGHRPSR